MLPVYLLCNADVSVTEVEDRRPDIVPFEPVCPLPALRVVNHIEDSLNQRCHAAEAEVGDSYQHRGFGIVVKKQTERVDEQRISYTEHYERPCEFICISKLILPGEVQQYNRGNRMQRRIDQKVT